MPWLSWLIALLRAWLGIKAEIQEKQEEHAGELEQQNVDLKAEVAADQAALKADAIAPATKADKLKALEEGQE